MTEVRHYRGLCFDCGTPTRRADSRCRACYMRYAVRAAHWRMTATFWGNADTSAGPDGCWPWLRTIGRDGYGRVQLDQVQLKAHRIAYGLTKGLIPIGHQIDHVCRNRRCVNPSHLQAVTARVNVLRGETVSARNARLTHCVRGHEFTPENTQIRCRRNGRTSRRCVACGQMWNRKLIRA